MYIDWKPKVGHCLIESRKSYSFTFIEIEKKYILLDKTNLKVVARIVSILKILEIFFT